MKPSVCICIPTYNASRTLPATLESIIRQTYDNLTVFIVDNASTDDTLEIAGKYAAQNVNVKIFGFGINIGGEGNFSRCIQLAIGDYTAIYHADDVYDHTIVEKQVAFLEEYRDAAAVYTAARFIDEHSIHCGLSNMPGELLKTRPFLFNFTQILKAVLRHGNFIICPSVMVRTLVYKNDVRIWDGDRFSSSADLDVWLRILKKHQIGFINEPLIQYRISRHSFSYHYQRTRTEKHDMFLVLDDYVNEYSGTLLNLKDIRNYRQLLLRDNISRAVNLLIQNHGNQARNVLLNLLSLKSFLSAFGSFRNLFLQMLGYAAVMISLLPIGDAGRKLLARLKFGR